MSDQNLRILSNDETEHLTSLSRKQRIEMEARGEFPRRVPLSARVTGWLEVEVNAWLSERLSERDVAIAARRSPNPLAKANRKSARGGA